MNKINSPVSTADPTQPVSPQSPKSWSNYSFVSLLMVSDLGNGLAHVLSP